MNKTLVAVVVAVLCQGSLLHAQVLSVSPTFLAMQGSVGAVVTGTVTVTNAAHGALKWRVTKPDVSWLTVTPTGGTNTGTITVRTTGLAAGTYTAAFMVTFREQATTVSVSVTIAAAVAPPPSGYGPQPTITCPAGAVSVSPGSSIASAVSAAAAGTSFCLRAGTHPITSSIVPKSGDTFVGEYGAILDGTGWTSLDPTAAAFRAHNESVNNVTVSNLEIRNMPQQGIHACGNQCTPNNTGWIIDHCYIHHNRFAVQTGSNAIIRHNKLTDNFAASGTSGAYNIGFADNIEVLHNEIARNGAETKFGDSTRIWFHDNWVYAQTYNGTWLDGCDDTGADDAHYSVIENNVYEDIPIFSVFIEISRYVKVRNNTIRRSGWGGVQVGTAHHVLVEGNSIITTAGGVYAIQLRVDCGRQDFGALDYDLKNNTIQNNTLVGDYSGAITALVIDESLTTCDPSYLTNTKQNNWIGNHYDVTNTGASVFAWGVNPAPAKTWTQWQALPQDATGTVE